MPDIEVADYMVQPSPAVSPSKSVLDEKEVRQSLSAMLDGGVDGMDSFMASVGNFMSDEDFFEMKDMTTFRDMYDEYQKTPSSEQKESAAKLFESFSDLIAKKRHFSPQELKKHTMSNSKNKGISHDNRLAKMRNELDLADDDEEQSKIRADVSSQSPGSSVAQESTISDASAYQRGIKLSRLGANPLGVSVGAESYFTDDEE